MTNFSPAFASYGDGPWEGGLKWVKVVDHDEPLKVIDPGKNFGTEHCVGLLLGTGQVVYYRTKDVTRCDEMGNTKSSK